MRGFPTLRPSRFRADLDRAWSRAWEHLSRPGTWWDGAQRLAIVEACREALDCALCRERAAALSPFAVDGIHDSTVGLPENVVEVIHRVRTDSGRLTESWFRRMLDSGLSETEYVEIVGVVSTATALDTLAKGLGVPERSLPRAGTRQPVPPPPGECGTGARLGLHPGAGGRHRSRPQPVRRQDPGPGRQHPSRPQRRPGGGRGVLRAGRRDLPAAIRAQGLRHRVPRDRPRADGTDRRPGLADQPVPILNRRSCDAAP